MPLGNDYLIEARKNKNDEFYTRYEDVESEVMKFKDKFENKTVYCPCDTSDSNFVKFFIDNFDTLKINKLIYGSDVVNVVEYTNALVIDTDTLAPIERYVIKSYYGKYGEEIPAVNIAKVLNCDSEFINSIIEDFNNRNKFFLHTEHDYTSDITSPIFLDILKECDIVVTNPPFSLFVKFLKDIIDNKKDFLIVGQQNTISCKSVFESIVSDQVKIDYGFKGIAGWFYTPEHYKDIATAGEHIEGMIRVSGVVWYTSFDCYNERPFIKLKQSYYNEDGTPNNEKYRFFDNFRAISGLDEDCINVGKVKDIPNDYYGYMGVPISFFGKYNPKQFELIQLDHYGPLGNQDNVVDGKMTYRRIYVRLRKRDE